ncbi:MAG: acyl-CoA thioesterase [Bacteroidetes bacterium]|nr:acyl-CoA thioesterase [Bacteroidota bacterium]
MSHPGFSSKLYSIRFADCDPFGHLNNARYLDYFMNAREDHLRENYDFDIPSWMEKSGKAWVVKEHRIQFLRPVKVNEWVTITSGIVFQTETDNIVEFGMWDKDRKKLKALMWSNFQYIDMSTMRPVPYDAFLLDKFMPLLMEEELPDFAQRAVGMQKKYRA